jgi:hypothetical protein
MAKKLDKNSEATVLVVIGVGELNAFALPLIMFRRWKRLLNG